MIKNKVGRFDLLLGDERIPAEIPATVFSLAKEESAAYSAEKKCIFETKVELGGSEMASRHIYASVEGVLANAEFLFNGKSYGMMSSPERRYLYDITDMARLGENKISVVCHSPIPERTPIGSNGEPLLEYEDAKYLPDIGILKPIELLFAESALISDVRINQRHEGGRVTLTAEVDTIGDTDDLRHAITLVSPSRKIYFGGVTGGVGEIVVPDPELWYPASVGTPALYRLSVTLYRGAEAVDTYERRIGLCEKTLEYTENGAPYIKINGIRLFSLGAAYVTERSIIANINPAETEKLIKSAADMNMNTIAVVNSLITPSERFFELCDKYGILVWQNIPVPYVARNVAGAFASGTTETVRSIFKRISSHPSLALTYLGVVSESGGDTPHGEGAVAEFLSVCEKILDPVAKRELFAVPFITDPTDLYLHDERYLSDSDVSYAKSAIASAPHPLTLDAMADDANILSADVEDSATVSGAVENMLLSISNNLKFPYGEAEAQYAAALAPAYEISASIKRARFNTGNCMSAVFRQLNDTEALLSSAYFDAMGRARPIGYLAKNFNAPILINADVCKENVTFYMQNNTKRDYSGRLNYALYDNYGKCWAETTVTVDMPAATESSLSPLDFSKYIGGEPERFYLIYQLIDHNGVRLFDSVIFTKPKRHTFRDPEIKCEISGSGKRFSAKLSAKYFAMGVSLSFDDVDVKYKNNFVNILPTAPVKIEFETPEVMTDLELKDKVKIISIYNLGGR